MLFVPQFVVIDSGNDGTPVPDLDSARAALASGVAATIGGRLADGVYGADIDADDPVLGDAAAEALVAWCVRQGLPYLVRDSGRPGGRHVIAVLTHTRVKAAAWAKLCAEVADQLGVSVTDRTGQVLRLPTAPHRRGLPAPVLSCTITPAMVMDRPATRGPHRRSGRPRSGSGAGSDVSRSEAEFGLTCALARAGYDAESAWREVQGRGGKSAERGRDWWVRFMWVVAVTIAAAEEGLDESAAWQRVRSVCPRIERRWWAPVWARARAEAKLERPRRRRIGDTATTDAGQLQQIEDIQAGFATAVDALTGVDPRRRRSVAAALHALSAALVTRGGSMSTRDLSVRSRLDLATVRRALATAIEHGLITRVHEYAGGATDCHAYALGPATTAVIPSPGTSSLTRGTPHPHGTACPQRLRRTYQRDRLRWRLRCDVLASLAPGERLADSQHPAAKTLRSLHVQRLWWTSQTRDQQEARRTARRAVLAELHRSQRSAWLDWLHTRADITGAADRLLTRQARPADAVLVSTAPAMLHRGLADTSWRAGSRYTPPATTGGEPQLALCPA